MWLGLVWFGSQLLNTVVEQVLKKALAFRAEEHLPIPAREGVPAPPGVVGRRRRGQGAHITTRPGLLTLYYISD